MTRKLVKAIYDLGAEVEDDRVSDEFYFLIAEAVERFAPNLEFDHNRGRIIDAEGANWEEALEEHVKGAARRHAARLTARAERQQEASVDA